MIKKILLPVIIILLFSIPCISQSEQLVINFPQSSLPGFLEFENPKGSVKVTGYEGDIILVTGTLRYTDAEQTSDNGMHRIQKNILDISAEVNGNIVNLLCRTTGKTVDFDIKIPKRFSLKLKSLNNGNVEIINLSGDIVIENTNGDIALENISGSAVLSSVYGKISASFREVKPNMPMMLTSFEGDITLTLPVSVNASLRIKSDKGEIMSDFDIVPSRRKPVVTDMESTKVYTLEDLVTGAINSGGPEYVISSYTGNIYIKKK
jgi:hypothetical protein